MPMQEFEDAELLEKFAQEATRHYAFNLIVQKYQQRLYWHVRKLVVDHDDANDILQDIFVKVWNALPGFRQESQLYTWMYRIATNECLSFLRKKNRFTIIPFHDAERTLSDRLADDPLFTGEKMQLKLQQAILTLPPRQRVVFNMKYFDGKKYEEMAEILNMSVGGLKATYHIAVKKIEKYLLST
jgi:RNA polymerase sigma factor (sigma-70 family)